MLPFRYGFLLILTLLALPVGAEVIQLKNGDRIAGEFIRAGEDHIEWQSDKIGTLTIEKTEILDLRTSIPLKINGVGEPCLVEGMDEEHLVYSCGDDPEPRRVPLVSLAMIIPYADLLEGDSASWSGQVNLSGTYARGNEIRDDWKFRTHTEYRMVDWRHVGTLEYASYSSGKSEPELQWGGRYSLDWFFRERWFLSSDFRYGKDQTRARERYYNFGAGTGYQFWENPTTALALTGGVVYVADKYEVPAEPGPDFVREESRIAWRMGTDFRLKLPLGVSMFHRNEFVRSFEEDSDWQLTTTTGFSTLIVGQLQSEIKLDYQVDNDPQQDTEREDVRLVVGLSYEW